jgi:uncharacterized protein YegP (UPF0339 family)
MPSQTSPKSESPKTTEMKIEIYRAADGFRWRVKARNGEIVAASSEAFSRRYGARRNLRLTARALYFAASL